MEMLSSLFIRFDTHNILVLKAVRESYNLPRPLHAAPPDLCALELVDQISVDVHTQGPHSRVVPQQDGLFEVWRLSLRLCVDPCNVEHLVYHLRNAVQIQVVDDRRHNRPR